LYDYLRETSGVYEFTHGYFTDVINALKGLNITVMPKVKEEAGWTNFKNDLSKMYKEIQGGGIK
jgi:hypothetical protein